MIDRTIKIAENRRWISLADPYEVRDWCASPGCSKSELKDAVAAVGPSAEKVHQYLGQRMPAGAGRARPL